MALLCPPGKFWDDIPTRPRPLPSNLSSINHPTSLASPGTDSIKNKPQKGTEVTEDKKIIAGILLINSDTLMNSIYFLKALRCPLSSIWQGPILFSYVQSFGTYILLLSIILGPLACFPSELMLNYGSYREFGRVMSPVARPLPTQGNTNTEGTLTVTHASSGIRTHDSSV
jgi:hypothetical protein